MPKGTANLRAAIIGRHAKDRAVLAVSAFLLGTSLLGLLTYYCSGEHNGLAPSILRRLAEPGATAVMTSAICLLIVLLSLRRPGLVVRLKRFRHLSHYIPTWWAALSVCFLGSIAITHSPTFVRIVGLPVWVPCAPLLQGSVPWLGLAAVSHVLFWAYWNLRAHLPVKMLKTPPPLTFSREALHGKAGSVLAEPDAFLQWMRTDRPVESVQDDCLGTRKIAEQIATRLHISALSTHAVVGALGSGKSTVGHFLAEILPGSLQEQPFRVIQIELWPFLTSAAAMEGILNRIIDQLEQEIEIAHLRLIPRQYLDVLESMPGLGKSLARSLRGAETNPEEILKQIDHQALALNLHLVVWIDDLERFAGKRMPDQAEAPAESDRLSPVRALLHALGERKSMTVVVATTSLVADFDWDKIARYIYEIPLLAPEHTGQILKTFRDQCLREFIAPAEAKLLPKEKLTMAWLDPTPRPLQELMVDFDLNGSHQEHKEAIARTGGSLSIPQAMALLCKTPRALKQAMRRTEEIWHPSNMKGEFQFDQLLAMCLLRDGCPLGFAVLRDFLPQLQRSGHRDSHRFLMAKIKFDELLKQQAPSIDSDRLKTSELRLESAIEALGTNSDRSAIRYLAALWRTGLDATTQHAVITVTEHILSDPDTSGPQSFRASLARGDIYWRLFIDEQPISETQRDQDFMRRLLGASCAELAEVLADPQAGPALIDFEPALTLNWQGVLPALVKHHSKFDWNMALRHTSYRWFVTLFKILRKLRETNRITWAFQAEFEQSIRMALDLDPNLACELEQVFLKPDQPIYWFEDEIPPEQMSLCIREIFKELYQANVRALLEKLQLRWALKQLCFGPDANDGGKDPELAAVPEWLPTLFQAILSEMGKTEATRKKLLPQLAHIFVWNRQNEVRVDLGNLLLGDMNLLFDLVRADDAPDVERDRVMAVFFQASQNVFRQ